VADFKILGTLEIEGPEGPISLGGRNQRAVLAVLLLRPGELVSMERLVRDLWGEEPPKTAVTSLQNAVSQLRKALGPDVLETRAPGYVLRVERDRIDSHRFERLVAEARGVPAPERVALLREALKLWRGPALAEFAFDSFALPEARRLEELHLAALEERLDAELELGRHAEVAGELESLVAAEPLRERLRGQLMLALYRSGRQAEALKSYQEARRTLVDELGIEPGAALQQLHGAILRQEAGLAAPGAAPTDVDVEGEILRATLSGRVVPVLGLVGGAELARLLAGTFDVPADAAVAVGRVTQYVAAMQGLGPLHDELHALYSRPEEPGPMHRLLARLPALLRERGAPYQLIVTTAYDGGIERAFAEAGEELDVVTYAAGGPLRGRFVHSPPGAEPRTIDIPNAYADLSLEQRTVLLRLRGAADPNPERAWESFVVTEDDHIDYPGPSELEGVIPVILTARLRRSHFLFLGYDLADWNLRLVINRLRGGRSAPYASWAVRAAPTALERSFWRRLDVHALDIDEDAFAHLLDGRLDGMADA